MTQRTYQSTKSVAEQDARDELKAVKAVMVLPLVTL